MLDRGWFTRHRRMGERGNNSSGRSKNECVKRTCRSGNVALLSVEHPSRFQRRLAKRGVDLVP